MRVLYPLNSEQIGGGNRSILTLWSGLKPFDIQPTAVIPGIGPMNKACLEANIDHRVASFEQPKWCDPIGLSRSILQWRRLITNPNHDLIHSNDTHSARSVSLAAWLTDRPHICHVRFGKPSEYIAWMFRFLPKPTVFIFNSEALKRQMESDIVKSCPKSELRVVYNGIDLERFRPRDVHHESTSDRPRVGIVANLFPIKGHADFLRMAKILKDQGVPADYWIIGGDVYQTGQDQKLKILCKDLDLEKETTFFGHRSDMPELITQLDVLVCASHVEPFGRCLIEAMACEKPVVGTRVGGIPEVVEDQVTGLLVPPKSPEQLADAVSILLNSPSLRKGMGKAGRERATKLFSSEAHAYAIKSIYAGF